MKKAVPMFITLLFVLVIVSILSHVFKNHPVLLGADYSFQVIGSSMFPAQRPNDLVLVKHLPLEAIQIGDVICFWRWSEQLGYHIVGHRVIEVQLYPYVVFKTKGDNNEFSDGWIIEEEIVGKEILNIPFGYFLQENRSFLLLTGLIVILILVLFK